MKKELTYSRAQQMLSEWDKLDGLRDDEAIKAFHINCQIEDAFKALEKNEIKLDNERQDIISDIKQRINDRKKNDDESVKDTQIQQTSNGSIAINNLPDDMEFEYRPRLDKIATEMRNLRQKTKTVTFEPLTRADLEEHDMLKNKILRRFKEIVDLSEDKAANDHPEQVKEEAA